AALRQWRLFGPRTRFCSGRSSCLLALPAARDWVGLGCGSLSLRFLAVFPGTTAFGLPLFGTWHAVADALAKAHRDFGETVAPAPVTHGFVLAAMGGVSLTAYMGDWAGCRLGALFEPVIPGFALFLFTSVMGAPAHRAWAMGSFV